MDGECVYYAFMDADTYIRTYYYSYAIFHRYKINLEIR
jgi:hypothetical protein